MPNKNKGEFIMFCPKCGKELTEGTTCSCGYSAENEQSASSLPDGKAIVDGAKNAAAAIKNNPYVSEVIAVITGAAADPEKQVRDNSERIDILWIIMAVLEAAVTSLGLAVYICKLISTALDAALSGYYSVDLPKGLFFKLFGAAFLWSAICIFALILIYMLFMKVCKKQTGFFAAANTMTTAIMPSALLTIAAGVLSLIYAPLGTLLIAAAVISLIGLCSGFVRSADGTKMPAFWLFVIFASAAAAVCALAGNVCVKMFLENMTSSIFKGLL